MLCIPFALSAQPILRSDANLDAFEVTHVDLNLDVIFPWRRLDGEAILTVRRIDPQATQLVLDSRGLEVTGVDQLSGRVLGATEPVAPFWVSRPFRPGSADPLDGTPIVIDLPPSREPLLRVRVHYQTTAAAPGLHWSRSEDRGAPFFYLMARPYGARGWIPLPDTPRSRMTFRFHVHTPDGMVVLISGADDLHARPDRGSPRGTDHWLSIDHPVAAAGLDLVVADLEYAPIGADLRVYAAGWSARREARALAAAPAVRAEAARLFGVPAEPRTYVVMPADFARDVVSSDGLTLLSPTLFGDARHGVPLAARLPFADVEASVPAAGRRDRWIAQALAAYLQSRIVESLYGVDRGAVLDALAYARLDRALAGAPPAAQILHTDAAARADCVDGAFIPYAKGRLFLRHLEAGFGRAPFDAFLRGLLSSRAGQPISTSQFVAAVDHDLRAAAPTALRPGDLEEWIDAPGLPQDAALPDAPSLRAVDAARGDWLAGRLSARDLAARRYTSGQWAYLLEGLRPVPPAARLAELDSAGLLPGPGDARDESLWLALGANAGYEPALDAAPAYLRRTGRLDLIAPVYSALLGSPRGAAVARRVYSSARPGYDPSAAALLDSMIGPGAAPAQPQDRNEDQ
ncbi:MAG: leukotriene A4 hydrolase C-terminal domain-containing protein [Gammaproteobacteria bacterium]|nr:leukotriene A4 hydrolase C-terminal domain-containing protein [Gammaproteobacteria bacterium]